MGSAALETVLRFDSAIPKGRQFPRLQEITANSSLLQLVLMIGNKQPSPRVKKCIFFIRSWTVLSGVILFGNISLWGKKCADISEISLLMLNAFPLWAVSLLVKFLYASIFILVEKKKISLLKLSLSFICSHQLPSTSVSTGELSGILPQIYALSVLSHTSLTQKLRKRTLARPMDMEWPWNIPRTPWSLWLTERDRFKPVLQSPRTSLGSWVRPLFLNCPWI